jgi:hypothetical protein
VVINLLLLNAWGLQETPAGLVQNQYLTADTRAANAEAQMQQAGDIGDWIGVDSTLEVNPLVRWQD